MTHSQARARPATAGQDEGALVASASQMRWRAPELALLMADHASAAAAAGGVEPVRLRAEVLAVFACNQLGRGAEAGGRAVRALRATQQAGDETTERLVRVELAACAADASAPSAGLTVLQPVFGRVTSSTPTARAAAMVTAADCVARLGGGPDVEALLTCADQLYDLSRSVEPDAVLLRRGVVHGRLAAYHRRRGDFGAAESTARTGLALVEALTDKGLDTGQVSGALMLELALALLDSGRMPEAVVAAQPVLQRPARPAGAPAACWLRLALVSRVHLPAGRHALARRLLGEAAADAERNHLDAALAECRNLQAQLHETCAELGEALQSIRAAYAADRRWRDTAAELRTTLAAEFGPPALAAELRSALAEVLAASWQGEASPPRGRGWPARSRHAAPTPLPVAPAVEPTRPEATPPTPASPHAVPQPVPLAKAAAPHPMLAHPPPRSVHPQPPSMPAHPPPPVPAHSSPQPMAAQSPSQPVPVPTSVPVGARTPPVTYLPVAARSQPVDALRPDHAADASDSTATSNGSTPGSEPGEPGRPAEPELSEGSGLPESPRQSRNVGDSGVVGPLGVLGLPRRLGPLGGLGHRRDSGSLEGLGRLPEALAPTPEPDGKQAPLIEPFPEPPSKTAPQDKSGPLEYAAVSEPAAESAALGHATLNGTTALEPSTPTQAPPDRPDVPSVTIALDKTRKDRTGQPGTNGFDRSAGRHRSDLAMVDLLAEALLAYQNGQSETDTTAAGMPEPQDVQQPRHSTIAAAPSAAASLEPLAATGLEPQEAAAALELAAAVALGLPVDDAEPPMPQEPHESPLQPPESPMPKRVRLIDMPREMVWREPGWDQR